MSDDSSGSDAGSSPPPETLVAGRAKRINAGNRLSHLLQHLDDEDVKADLVADEEDDQRDYSASEDEDGDVALDSSSSSDEDDRPGMEDAGEKELRKQERVESGRKRKARELVRIQPRKRVKISDLRPDGQSQDFTKTPERPALADHAPVRQSSRSQTIANAKLTEAKIKESRKRAEKTHEMMRIAAEKKAAEAGPRLTQADRMARALVIEKENAKSLNRWAKSERDRQQAQRDKLDAMRNKTIDGPVIRYWSGPVSWTWRQGPDGPVYARFKYERSRTVSEVDVAEANRLDKTESSQRDDAAHIGRHDENSGATAPASTVIPVVKSPTAISEVAGSGSRSDAVSQINVRNPLAGAKFDEFKEVDASSEDAQSRANGMLDDVQNETTKGPDATIAQAQEPTSLKSTASLDPATIEIVAPLLNQEYPLPSMPPYHHVPRLPLPSTTAQTSLLPLLTERAARSLLILDQFPALRTPPVIGKRGSGINGSSFPQDSAVTSILLPGAHPPLTMDEKRYLSSKTRRATLSGPNTMPPAPARAVCAISGKPARFRDPKTSLEYANLAASKAIQRVLANGCQWSPLLGVWAGIVGDGSLGRVARGVPKGFWNGEAVEQVKKEGNKKEVIEIS